MSNGPDIPAMQRHHEERLRGTVRYVIAETEEGFEVHEWTHDGVTPWALAAREAAAARLLQLMGITRAVVPQGSPEGVCVGRIEREGGADND